MSTDSRGRRAVGSEAAQRRVRREAISGGYEPASPIGMGSPPHGRALAALALVPSPPESAGRPSAEGDHP